MIESLDIANLGVIASAHVDFGPGLIVVTGETGAGKTMVLSSLQLLLGARADAALVRSGADRLSVDGIFTVGDQISARVEEAGGIVEGGEHGGIGHDAVSILDDLGDNDLRVRGAAAYLATVSGCDRGDVRAVVQVFFGSGYDVGVVVGVVVGEGDLVGDPRAGGSVGQAGRQGCDVRLVHADGGGVEGA